MRGAIGRLRMPICIGSTSSSISISTTKQGFSPLSAAFSTSSSGGGSGRGRGRGGPASSQSPFVSNQPENPKSSDASADPTQSTAPIPGRGHGRGKPLPSSPFLPSFNTFVAPNPAPSPEKSAAGVGRGRGGAAAELKQEESMPKKPMFFRKDDGGSGGSGDARGPVNPNSRRPIGEANLPGSMQGVLSGMGRGQAVKGRETVSQPEEEEENRHIRRPRGGFQGGSERVRDDTPMAAESGDGSGTIARPPKLSREEAKNKAMNILSRGDSRGRRESVEDGRGRGEDGGRGRGSGRGRGRGRNREAFGRDGDWRREKMEADAEDIQEDDDFFVGDDADGEKFAKQVGPEMMNMLTEAFEEVSYNVLPSVAEDEVLDALDLNLKIELEPEYLMADFETNPDIDEKPPIPLRDALEKMKPFLMAYEGIQSEEEWKEVVEDTMERVPLLKEIVDYYAGPDSVTAKQQQEELERVAKTLPASTPDSVKRFTDRAVLTLQSNPGWGFDKKCQFMDKLVAGVSQVYK